MSSLNLSSLGVPCIPTQSVVAPGIIDSFILDTAIFRATEFYVVVDCSGDTFAGTITLQDSQDPLFSFFTPVGNNFLTFSNDLNNLDINETDTITVRSLGYVGKKRYVRFEIDVTASTSSSISVFCVLAKPLTIPFSYSTGTFPPGETEFRVTDVGDFRITDTGDNRIAVLS